MIRYYFRFFLACAILASSLLPSSVIFAGSSPTDNAAVTIDISSLMHFFGTLPPDEKEEQLRDWAAYGLKSRLASSFDEEIPIRHPALKDSTPGEVSPGRVVSLSTKEWAVILSKELLKNKSLIGGLVDGKYAGTNSLPEKISLFACSYDASSSISITFAGSIDAKDLFTPEYGYYRADVGNLSEFENFIKHVDDVVSVEWRPTSLVLGGRKYVEDSRRALTVEEVAVLYQAYNLPENALSRAAYESSLRKRYPELLRSDEKLRDSIRRGVVKKSQIMAKLRRQFPFTSRARKDVNIGFSLDIDHDYSSLADDLEQFAQLYPELVLAKDTAFAARSGDFATAARRIRTRKDISPLLALRRRYATSTRMSDVRINNILQGIELSHSYQTARYDGRLQGTRTGMILFYTDLLAKLWAFDYNGMASETGIIGFHAMPEIRLPKLYWGDFSRFSKTRLWFGLKQEGFEVFGNKAMFQPVATHVYAASSDPLNPGKESPPNYQSKGFLGWWDRHYEVLAEYEPEYHKLNEVQKWSCIIMMLKENNSHVLDFLSDVPVERSFNFEIWNKNNDTLKSRISAPFLDMHKYGRTTECLPLLRSKSFPLMGNYSMLSGGVSLASRNDILAKLHKRDKPSVAPRRSATESAAKERTRLPFAVSATAKPPAIRHVPVAPSAQPVGVSSPQNTRTMVVTRKEREAGRAQSRSEGTAYKTSGADGTEKQEVIKLKWEKSPSIAMTDFVTTLAALQEVNAGANKGEAIFNNIPDIQAVVRIKEGETYLVKLSAMKGAWLYLSVNPSKMTEFPARAAGAFPEADIFCSKQVTAAFAQKLAAGKTVIK